MTDPGSVDGAEHADRVAEVEAPRPRIRASPEDFVVEEIPLYPVTGEGGHTFVEVEKRLRTTEQVARQLARAAGVPARDVGYAGRKDRVAVARQRFSVPGLEPEAAMSLVLDGARVLGAWPHPHKLRTGQLRGNRFEIRVREVSDALVARAQAALETMQERGMPNRFGSQRFGHEGRNVERARALLGGRPAVRDRREARFLLSALQAEVFNQVLSRRALPIDAVERGDVAQVRESGGLFLVEDEQVEGERAARFEISATGPIFGTKMMAPAGVVAERESEIMRELGIPPPDQLKPPRGVRLRGTRRPLRVPLEQATLVQEDDALLLRFELPAGSYATVALAELFGPFDEGRRSEETRAEDAPT